MSIKALTLRLRRFRDQEDGLVLTEFLILLPILIWTFMALFIYWDAFRMINQGQKATYSISDLISRQSAIDMTFVDGTQDVMEYFIVNSQNIRIRITSAKFDADNNVYVVLFSRSPGWKMAPVTNSMVNGPSFRERLPITADQHSVVIVESEVSYTPGLKVGIPPSTFRNFIVTRPRNETQVCLIGQPCPSIVG